MFNGSGFQAAEAQMRSFNGVSQQQLGEASSHATAMGQGVEESTSRASKGFSAMKAVAGAALMGIGMYMTMFVMSAISMAAQVMTQLDVINAAYGRTKGDVEQTMKDMVNIGKQTGYSLEQINPVMSKLSMYTHGNMAESTKFAPMVTAVADSRNMEPGQAADIIGKAMMGRPQGLAALGIDKSEVPKDMGTMSIEDKYNALNAVLAKHGIQVDAINEAYKKSPEGAMNLFNLAMQQLEMELAIAVVPVLLVVVGAITDFVTWLGEIPGGFAVFGIAVVALLTLTLLAGPLMALSALGINVGGIFTGLGSTLKNVASSAIQAGAKLIDFIFGTNLSGSAAEKAAVKQEVLAGSQAYAGNSAVIEAGEQDTLAVSETGAGSAAITAGIAIAGIAAAAWVVWDLYNSINRGNKIPQEPGGSTGAGIFAGLGNFSANLPLPWLIGQITGKTTPDDAGIISQYNNLGPSIGNIPASIGNFLGMGPASAAGPSTALNPNDPNNFDPGKNKPTLQEDIFGKNGLIDFTRQINQVKSIYNGAMSYIKGVTGGAGNYIRGAWNNTIGFVTGLYNRLRGAWNNTVAFISGAWTNTVAYIGGAWANTVAWVVGGASQIYAAGANAFWGIYNAVVGALAAAWSYIQNFVTSVVNALQQAWNAVTGGPSAGGDGTNVYAGGDGTNIYKGSVGTTHKSTSVTHNHTWNIGSVDSKETADYVVDQVIQRFTKENDIRGN